MPSLVMQGSTQSAGASMLFLLVPLLLLGFMILSARRRNKQTALVQASLQVGDRVCTTSGMYGILRELDERTGALEVAPNVTITFDRRALLPAAEIAPAVHHAKEAEEAQ